MYAVQCVTSELDRAPAAQFWTQLAHLTGGRRITMEAFSTVVDLMLAVCYRETAPEFLQVWDFLRTPVQCYTSKSLLFIFDGNRETTEL